MNTIIKKLSNRIINATKSLINANKMSFVPVRMTEDEIRQYVEKHTDIIKHAVGVRAGVNLSDIPIRYQHEIPDVNYACFAAYTCETSMVTAMAYQRHLAGNETIVMNLGTLGNVSLPKRTYLMIIDCMIAHELYHAADARRDSSVFTEIDLIPSPQSPKEQYTDWRAVETVCEVLYPTQSARFMLAMMRMLTTDNVKKFSKLSNKWTASAEEIA